MKERYRVIQRTDRGDVERGDCHILRWRSFGGEHHL
jgi:hypothetical protein